VKRRRDDIRQAGDLKGEAVFPRRGALIQIKEIRGSKSAFAGIL
jgi:hypothetical protein